MNSLKGLAGLAAVVALSAVGFYIYSNASNETNPPQTATVTDSIYDSPQPQTEGEKVAVSGSTTTPSRPPLNGFKENELQEGLESIKAGLDLLQNPFE